MNTSSVQVAGNVSPAPAQKPAPSGHGFSFHDLLSALNPLQYLPLVGTIYRAVTGDVIPEALRRAGSMVVSGLLGGPVGLATNVVMTLAEKMSGIDPDKVLARQFDHAPPPVASPVIAVASPVPATLAWTPRQLAAYGVSTDAAGNLRLGDITGADVLNSMELARLSRTAAGAYAAIQSMPASGVRSGSPADG